MHIKTNSVWLKSVLWPIKPFALFIALLLGSSAVIRSHATDHALVQPQLRQLSSQNGLSQNSVNSFYQDQDGYIWISTLAGVNRFDGTQMLEIEDPNELFTRKPFNSVSSDLQGNYWFNGREGLIRVSESAKTVELAQFPAQQRFWSQANMLVGSAPLDESTLAVFTWNGLYLYSPEQKDIRQPSSMQAFHSKSLNLLSFLGVHGGFWLGTSDGLYFYHSDEQRLEKLAINNPRPNFKISGIQSLNSKNLLLTTNLGIFQLSVSEDSLGRLMAIHETQQSETPLAATSDKQSLAFYSVGDKIFRYLPSTNKSTFLFSLKDNLPKSSEYHISSLFLDSNRLLWIGTQSQGAFLWDTKIPTFESWSTHSQEIGWRLDDDEIWSVKLNKNNDYLAATGKGLNLVDAESGKVTHLIDMSQLASDRTKADVFDVIELGNTLWLATQYGLIEFNQTTKQVFQHLPRHLESTDPFTILSMTSIDNKIIWLATHEGLMSFNILLNEFTYNRNIMTRFNATKTRHVSYQNGLLWVGTEQELFAYDLATNKNKVIFEVKKDFNGQHFLITDLLVEGDIAWVAFAGDGIYGLKFDNDRVEQVARYHTSTGLPDNQIFALEKLGHLLWATTSQGLLRINIQTGQHALFDSNDGLLSNEFNEGSSVLLDSGDLLLGSTRGLTKVTPRKLLRTSELPPPKISEAKVFSGNQITHLWPIHDQIELSEASDLLNLQLTDFDFMQNKSSVFEYWFDSDDNSQIYYTTDSRLTLADLTPGTHYLNIRTKILNSANTSAAHRLTINVTQTSQLTTATNYFALVAMIILISLVVFYLFKHYQNSQRAIARIKKNERRLELALLDEHKGVWDCCINSDILMNSEFSLYQHQHQPLEQSIGKYIASIHPDDLAASKLRWEQLINGEVEELDITYRCYFFKRWFWCRFQGRISEYYKNGTPRRATGTWQNVDKEKSLETKLNLYSTAFESTQDIILILDKDFEILFVNNAYEFTTGFSADALVGQNMVDVSMSRASGKETEHILNQLKQNNRWHGQSSIARKNAASFPIEVKINLIEQNNEKVGYVVVMSEISQSKEVENRSIKNNFYDRSTGLPSKTLAFDRLRQQIARCRKNGGAISLIFLGIDHFNRLKTALRPASLDALFSQLTSRLLPYIRKNDLLARYEPDIFLIVLQHANDESNVLHTVNQLLRELSKPLELNDQQINLSACAGISNYPDDGENWSELITKGETALAQTKQQGSNLFKYYHEDSNKKALERVALENKLSRALEESELFLVFQPILELASKNIIELDVNWRWRTDDDKIIYPSQFLPLISELGMIREFSDWLISNALATLQRWNQEGLSVCININLSIEYLATSHAIEFLRTKLASHKINPKFVFISILEDDPEFSVPKLEPYFNEIYSLGLNMVLDEFGKQRASLKDITALKFHSVRISKDLIRSIGRSKTHDDMLVKLLDLMQSLTIGSVAKGIENEEQLNFLTQHACKYGQGYFISDPLNESQARQSLLSRT